MTTLNKKISIRLAVKPIVLSIQLILASGTLLMQQQIQANTAQQEIQYNIQAGSLTQALNQFALQAGVKLSLDSKKLTHLNSTGLQGQYSIDRGFQELLKHTDYQIKKIDNGYTVVEKHKTHVRDMGQLNTIDVNANLQNTASNHHSNLTQLPLITVTAENDGYAPRQVTIGKMDQGLKEIPQSISVITRQLLDDQNATTLTDAMRYATGVSVYGNGSDNDSFYARGGTVNLSFNGVPSAANNKLDMAVYEQVEVLRGPNGLLSGSGNPTATVNLVRKRALAPFQGNVAVNIGSWNNYRSEADISGALTDANNLRGRAIVVTEDREYFYDRAESWKILGSGILEYDLTDATTIGLSATVQQLDMVPFLGFPAYSDGKFLDLSRSTNLDADYNKTTRDTWEIMADLSHQFNDNWKAMTTVRYYQGDSTWLRGNPRAVTAATNSTGGVVTGVDPISNNMGFEQIYNESDQTTLAADLHLTGKFELFGKTHELLLGANYDESSIESGSANIATANTSNWFNPGYAQVSDFPRIATKNETKTTQSGVYGMLRFKVLDPLTLVLGSRFTDYSNKSRVIYPAQAAWSQGAKETGEFTPYGGLVFDINHNISWYASYADVFIPQTTRDYRGVVLDPRIGWQIESGFKAAFFDGRLNGTLAAFQIRDENSPVNDPNPLHTCTNTSGAPTTCQIAGGLTETKGWEFDVSGQVFEGFNLTTGYTRVDITPLKTNTVANNGVVTRSTTYRPKHIFKLWGNYQFQPDLLDGALEGLSIGGGLYAQGEAYGGTIHQGGFTTVALQAGYKINPHLSATLTINNLFDKVYYHQINDQRSYNYYGDPRNFMLSARYQF